MVKIKGREGLRLAAYHWSVFTRFRYSLSCPFLPLESPSAFIPYYCEVSENRSVQKWTQAGLQKDFWRLDKSQHSSGTCEMGSPSPKGVISFASGDGPVPVVTFQSAHWPPVPSVSAHTCCHISKAGPPQPRLPIFRIPIWSLHNDTDPPASDRPPAPWFSVLSVLLLLPMHSLPSFCLLWISSYS